MAGSGAYEGVELPWTAQRGNLKPMQRGSPAGVFRYSESVSKVARSLHIAANVMKTRTQQKIGEEDRKRKREEAKEKGPLMRSYSCGTLRPALEWQNALMHAAKEAITFDYSRLRIDLVD
ncbi:MAG: hypothetical protein JWR21_1821 [Herminiimonas sp.]|nr:hypothetical protein [Herminiimonas sp.]